MTGLSKQLGVRRLVVTWLAGSELFAIGELIGRNLEGPNKFEFGYLEGVARALERGFQPFAAFGHVGRRYTSPTLFPFFQNRVMSSARPDYAAHLALLGLGPGPADPLDLLERSGGRRATDSVAITPA